jgi:hypothetical protein
MTRFFACKLELYIPGSATALASNLPWSSRPFAVAPDMVVVESTDTVRASDVGYRDATDGVYPPLLNRAFDYDRAVALQPGADAVGASWGTMSLLNPEGTWDGVAAARSCDGRPLVIYTGQKVYDPTRGIYTDPAFASLTPFFQGIAKGWFLSETELEIPLTDATYFIEKPLQSSFYLGTGGYEGPATMTGTPKPKTRGGTASFPVQNVSPVLVDATNLIYQYNDAAGTVVALYEGSAVTYTSGGNVADLYASPPSPGQFKTDNARGLFRLGTKPVRPITADVTGNFPSAGVQTTAANIARNMLLEDVGLAAGYIDTASFTALNTSFPWTCGYYFGVDTDATQAVSLFLRSVGAKLIAARDGKLKAIPLRAVATSATPAATLTTSEIVNLTVQRMGEPLDPPADLWRIGWNANHTLQTTDLSPLITDARKTYVASDSQIAGFFSAAINAAYKRPSRPAVVQTALLTQADADALADAVGALWSTRRRLFAVEVPVEVGILRDLGDVVRIIYPMDDLNSGRLGIVVGEKYRSTDSTMTLQVLV